MFVRDLDKREGIRRNTRKINNPRTLEKMAKGLTNLFLPEDQKKEGRVQVGFGCIVEGKKGKGMEFLNKV